MMSDNIKQGDTVQIVKDGHRYLSTELHRLHSKEGRVGQVVSISKRYAFVTTGGPSNTPDWFFGKWALKNLQKLDQSDYKK